MAARKRIVILGSGFAGAYCAQKLESALRGLDAEVVLIDQRNYFIFFPLLVEAGTGSLEPRHAVVSIRAFLKDGNFRMGSVVSIDTAAQSVAYKLVGEERVDSLAYDHLVLALGSVTNLPPVPGLREFAFEIKNIGDAITLRDRAIQMLELADATTDPAERKAMLHFVVVGANFTGVEVAGEYLEFLAAASKLYRNVDRKDCQITLVERGDRILQALKPELSDFAIKALVRRGMRVVLNTSATEIGAHHAILSNGERLETRSVIWCAGVAAPPILKTLNLPTDPRGWLLCERDTRVKDFANIWGIGDCAVNPDAAGLGYPPTAQHAIREGEHCALNIARALRGEPTTPCDLTNMGSLAALGCRTGVAEIMGIKLSGFPAWFMWRTVYLMKMPGWSRRIRIAIDWTLDFLFKRTYVQLGLYRRPKPESGAPTTSDVKK